MRIKFHEHVMLNEVLENLNLKAHLNNKVSKKVIDATLGTAGHAIKICERASLLGLEVDRYYFEVAKKRLEGKGKSFKVERANFVKIDEVAKKYGFTQVDGILFDLGVNTLQLTSKTRGLSFTNPKAKLDMRLDKDSMGLTAFDLLNALREEQIFDLFEPFVGYRQGKDLAKKVVKMRKIKSFDTVGDFLQLFSKRRPGQKTHPATLAFLALRVAVNGELKSLKEALPKAFNLLKKGGRLAVITFHSGEDSIVKGFFKKLREKGKAKLMQKAPLTPSREEIFKNPKSRSAKLRTVEKV